MKIERFFFDEERRRKNLLTMVIEIEMDEIDLPIEGPEDLVRPMCGDPWRSLLGEIRRVGVHVWGVNGGARVILWVRREKKVDDEFLSSNEFSDADTEIGNWNE